MPEAGVEQVQHRVLRPANVEIDRHPRLLDLWIDQGVGVLRVEKSQIVPAGAGPLRHGVGLALVATAIAKHVEPTRRGLVQRRRRLVVLRVELHPGGQIQRQLRRVERADPSGGVAVGIKFVQDRERFAPEMLPAEEPVAKFVVDRRAAETLFGKVFGNLLLELWRGQAVVRAGIDGIVVTSRSNRTSPTTTVLAFPV